jgi:hypothetical protein
MAWVNLAGLACGFVGAVVLAAGLVISKARAVELSVSRLSGETVEENLKLPAVEDRRRQSSRAVVGLSLIALGFVLQAVAAWP